MWYIWATLLFLSFVLLAIGITAYRTYKKRLYDSETPPADKKEKGGDEESVWGGMWNKGKTFWSVIQLLIGFGLCHLLVYKLWPVLYDILWHNEWFWWDHLVVAFVYLVLRKENKKGKTELQPVGNLVLAILIVGNVWIMVPWLRDLSWFHHEVTMPQTVAQTSSNTPSPIVFPEILQDNPDAVEANRVFREKIPSTTDAATMLWIAKLESDFHQFNPDGTVLHNKTEDTGIMEIHEPDYLEKSKVLGFDIYKLKDNLDMALWIYQNDGARKWVTYDRAVKLARGQGDYDVTAPVGHFGEMILLVTGTILRPSGPVLYRDDKGRLHEDDKGGAMRPLIVSTFIEPQSRTSEPVKVTVSR